jgi:hypothetical protein
MYKGVWHRHRSAEEAANTMQEKQERTVNSVNGWEVKQTGREKELNSLEGMRRKNNFSIFGINERPHGSYCNALKKQSS